ncbi:MAG: penicillin-binding protein 2, partial [Halobacteria archaeon]|nr:penicillin-binding protein 2 [Halobacteria archaeon]
MARINGLALKDHIRESLIFNRRLLTAIIVTVLLLLVLMVRLMYLQIIHQEHYSTLSEENRVNILPIPPARGLIYDRNGVVLAQNLPSFSLRLVPEHVPDLEQTLTELRSLIAISDEDIQRFHKYRKQKRRFEGIPLRFRLD